MEERPEKVTFQQILGKNIPSFTSSVSSAQTLQPACPHQHAIWIFKQQMKMKCIPNEALVNV